METRIFLIEDDIDIADSLTIRLRANGMDVRRLVSGEGAVDAVREYDPNLILLDITLPGDDGISVAAQLDESFGTGRPPVIFLTASMREDIMERAAAIPRSRLMSKPFKSNELLTAMEQAIEMGRSASSDLGEAS